MTDKEKIIFIYDNRLTVATLEGLYYNYLHFEGNYSINFFNQKSKKKKYKFFSVDKENKLLNIYYYESGWNLYVNNKIIVEKFKELNIKRNDKVLGRTTKRT